MRLEGHIDTVNPAAGSQHLRISKDQDVPIGGAGVTFSPVLGPLATGPSTTSVDVAISATGGASYGVEARSASEEGVRTWFVVFFSHGEIAVLDDEGSGVQFVYPGILWDVGPYRNLTVCDDPVAGTTTRRTGSVDQDIASRRHWPGAKAAIRVSPLAPDRLQPRPSPPQQVHRRRGHGPPRMVRDDTRDLADGPTSSGSFDPHPIGQTDLLREQNVKAEVAGAVPAPKVADNAGPASGGHWKRSYVTGNYQSRYLA